MRAGLGSSFYSTIKNKGTAMSIEALAWALKQTAGDSVGKLLLVTLANYADDNGRAWPSQAKLAVQCEISVDTVQRRLARLERRGLLKRERRRRADGGWTTSAVTLAYTAISAARGAAAGGEDTADPAVRDPASVRQQEPSLESFTLEKEKNRQEERARAISIPENFEPDMIDAQRLGMTLPEAADAVERFVDHARANDRRSTDWPAAWRNWVRIGIDQRTRYPARTSNGGGGEKPRKRTSAEVLCEIINEARGNASHGYQHGNRSEHFTGTTIEGAATR